MKQADAAVRRTLRPEKMRRQILWNSKELAEIQGT
jgi:hypothetical protein